MSNLQNVVMQQKLLISTVKFAIDIHWHRHVLNFMGSGYLLKILR